MAFFAAYPISLDATALLIFLVLPCCPPLQALCGDAAGVMPAG